MPSDHLLIGAATDDEKAWCARLMAASEPWITLGRGLEACRAVFARSDHATFVARRAGRPLGFIVVRERGVVNSPYLPSIAVAPEARGQGVGSALLEFAERQVVPGAPDIFLLVSSFNPDARRLYERHGYQLVGELPGYVIDTASEFLLRKRLRR